VRRNGILDTAFDYSGRCEESVNRRQIRALIALAASLAVGWAVPARAQTALTVGSVRDRSGEAIAGATVEGLSSGGALVATTQTDAAGTFALAGARVGRLTIDCQFCQETSVEVVPGKPVVAIVRRFEALLYDSPSPSDLENLPYSRVESSIALRPFTMLRQTSDVTTGSQLDALGFAPAGSLLVDSGVPSYDVVDGTTPYDAIPQDQVRSAGVAPPADAFLYGDRAGSGTVSTDPFGDDNELAALVGGDTSIRLQAGTLQAGAVLTASDDATDWRQRFDGQFQARLTTTQTLGFDVATSQYRETGTSGDGIDGAYSFARGSYTDNTPGYDVAAGLIFDRGIYSTSGTSNPYDAAWADSVFSAGVRTHGTVFAFADAGVRLSSGSYDATGDLYDATGSFAQRRIDYGFEADEPDYQIIAGAGTFGVDYQGYGFGDSGGYHTALTTPSFQIRVFPKDRWSATFAANESFTLPTLVEQYDAVDYDTLALDRASSVVGTLSYTDFRRVRVDIEAATQHVYGVENGLITSAGFSTTWQFAPAVSLRAWIMHVDDATTQPPLYSPYLPTAGTSNVDAIWLTYQNPGAIRFDAIYRRDLLNGLPFEHIDGDVSGPLLRGLRWYAGVQDVMRVTYLSAGLQFGF
jgi:hypothetical protein